MSGRRYGVACLAGSGTAQELMAEASLALEAVTRVHGVELTCEHVSFGADALTRVGQRVPLATRLAYLRADAVLVAGADEPALLDVCAELDLRARLTAVRFGAYGDLVLLSPLARETASWTLERAFALARSRRLRLASVANDGRWKALLASTARGHEEVDVEHVPPHAALLALAHEPDRFDVVISDLDFADALVELASRPSHARVSARALLGANGPGVYVPCAEDSPALAGQGVVNPSSMLLAAALMLDGLGEPGAASTLAGAVSRALQNGARTPDRLARGVAATTREFTSSVLHGFQLSVRNAEFWQGAA